MSQQTQTNPSCGCTSGSAGSTPGVGTCLLQPTLTKISNELTELKTKVEVIEEQLTRNEYKVAFGATLGSVENFGPFHTTVTLAYNNVYVNEGGAYNPATGVFTASIRGVYYFAFTGHNFSSKVLNVGLFKNEEQMVIAFNHPFGARYESASNSVSMTLQKGDRVCVRLCETSWVYDNYNHHNSFSGHLLFPL